ncbi:MAG: hypothetical protein C0432_02555 [Candidatus Puniceispirillum sp.]|nr:hypothetical protein [Candidatus Pelagibacter sp.]MBA4283156.1 hypothetical protein [Candidatus Puniceispirillum sp.]
MFFNDFFIKQQEFFSDLVQENPCLTIDEWQLAVAASLGWVKLEDSLSEEFCVGKNLATASGQVVLETPLMQLIHYPSAQESDECILIVSPWINKFYIFDLDENKSFVQHLNNSNINVFCVSWANPDESYCDIGFQDMIFAVEQAMVIIQKRFNSINLLGYCVGGILSVILTLKHAEKFKSLTLIATPLDFSELKNLSGSCSNNMAQQIKFLIDKEGYFHGERMHQIFSFLKVKEMIHQEIIQRIVKKEQKKPIDYLFWNKDSSNISGKLHYEYIRNIFSKNDLMKKLFEKPIRIPTFILALEKDHIVPPSAIEPGIQYFKNHTYCLGDGGHVAGVVHHFKKSRYNHTLNFKGQKDSRQGSWISSWIPWFMRQNSKNLKKNLKNDQIILKDLPMRTDNQKKIDSLLKHKESAPGRFVLQKVKKNQNIYIT